MVSKFILGLSVMVLGFMAVGTHIAPNELMFWFASTSVTYQVVRILLIIALFVQLITRPPRHIIIRLLTGGVALSIGIWTLIASYSYQMPALDTLAFLVASIAMGVIALEYQLPSMDIIDESVRGVKRKMGKILAP